MEQPVPEVVEHGRRYAHEDEIEPAEVSRLILVTMLVLRNSLVVHPRRRKEDVVAQRDSAVAYRPSLDLPYPDAGYLAFLAVGLPVEYIEYEYRYEMLRQLPYP